ncbi:hypothetical protein D3C80_953130 [compost metagenome]
MVRAEDAAQHIDNRRLDDHEDRHRHQNGLPVLQDHSQIERKPDSHEKQAEENSAERFDICFKLMSVRRFGQQHACNECTHCHG